MYTGLFLLTLVKVFDWSENKTKMQRRQMRRKTIGRAQALLEVRFWFNEFLSHKFIIRGDKKLIAKSHERWLYQVTLSQVTFGFESIAINDVFRNETLNEWSYWKFYEKLFASNKTMAM